MDYYERKICQVVILLDGDHTCECGVLIILFEVILW